ncbi:ABC transporter ATP-binding protein [Phycisphaera mikurensis]|uniref:Putative ABC transporter ATP-binding protein n=1 Tax=Phycisphaera mikurensis (strain NBRC 102666 / KCTC 22515 / FYK2301M01) TaxID=1142394 RepID=I0IG34_PHYMF|nr:ABC transporter ATP-binding protein [Phycisphaera mikurensis]MBB6440394.1 phospholipid/cholesterol/gamma-HCH transport system ATP-binding protein [Phycisphaera mikurensis]BAM04222.1 putative ABC transporter ATP-binding protein [Phycisphaera mikurensis NBRC 102666]
MDLPLVELKNVSKAFGSQVVLHDLSLSFERGKTTVVLGPSGTGKSVMLKHVMGLLCPDAGEVWFDGRRIDTLSERELVPVRSRIGFLFQMGALFDSMSAADNVAFPMLEHGGYTPAQRADKAELLLAQVGLPGVGAKMPGELSGGQKKRVALARAVALDPDLVLYDEPTTGLDPIRADVINELINALRDHRQITGIAVTHDMQSARRIADRMVLLAAGRIVADDEPAAFLASADDDVQHFIQGRAGDDDLEAIRHGFELGDARARREGALAPPAGDPHGADR